jgi:RNase H-fold protein (predicted Holliday junction resolvase)
MGERLALPVVLRDERLSSFEAEQRLGRMPRGRSGGAPSRAQRNAFRAKVDREAASIILQDELDARRGVTPGAPHASQALEPLSREEQ